MKLKILEQEIDCFTYSKSLSEIVRCLHKLEVFPNQQNLRSRDTNLLDRKEFLELRKWFEESLVETLKSRGYTFSVRLTQSWFNKTQKGQWHHCHNHMNSFLSGVFYLSESPSETWFSCESIWPKPTENLPFYDWGSQSNEVIAKVKTEPGNLLVFPSSLRHSVNEHTLSQPRYSISFNTFPVGTFGSEENLTLLNT